MYKIIGADGRESGPISAEEIRQGVADGRFDRATPTRAESESERRALGELPEFASLFAPAGQPTTPIPGATQTSALAVLSLLFGLLGIVTCITAPVGLVLGFMARSRIRASNGRLTGSVLATTGIVLSLIVMLLGWVMPTGTPKLTAQTLHCIRNSRQLGLAVLTYSTNNHGLFPPAETWCAAIQKEVGSTNVFQCGANPDLPCGYAFNARLAGKKADEVNPQTVMIFESDAGWNASGGPELMLKSPRHEGRRFGFINTDINTRVIVVGFADGHVETLRRKARLQQLRWDP